MMRKRDALTVVAMAVILTVLGCRATPPNLKPAKEPEVINLPPSETRFDSPNAYPAQAFADRNKDRRFYEKTKGPVMPAGGMGGMNGPGMGSPGR